jgi:hypothetical protein
MSDNQVKPLIDASYRGLHQTNNRRREARRSLNAAYGAGERGTKRDRKPKFSGAIFVHAGAGFHSHQNEAIHLEACNESV